MASISLKQLTKVFPGSESPSVDAVNLEIHDGDFLCILGPSGCGKSTTLRMIAGLEPISDGSIEIGDTYVDDTARGIHIPAEKRGLGFVFQTYALWPHMSVEDNVSFGPRMQKKKREESVMLVDEALKKLEIDKYRKRYPSELSGGQQQRVAIARTLAAQSEVLLLDEPLSNLDARLRLEMRGEFQRIHRETGATIVFVTHDQWEAMTMATRIAVMHDGRLQQVGKPMEVYSKPANRFVAEFMGNPPINIVERDSKGALARAVAEWADQIYPIWSSVGIRPENVRISTDRPQTTGNTITAELNVAALLPTGGSWIVDLEDDEGRWYALTLSQPEIAPEGVYAWFDSSMAIVFDEKGLRISQ